MKTIITLVLIALSLTACGSSGSSNENSGPPPSSNVDMEVSQSYSVFPGDSIIKDTEDSQLEITHIDGEKKSTVTLLSGSATIIRK